jgi:SAM-dependent methyltransferase
MRQERRLAFGSVAALYNRVRPSYPAQLVDEVIAYADIDRSARALEVGSGTGKATALFAQRGVAVHGVEPSASMAAIARRACQAYDRVEIEQSDFEDFSPDGRRFQLLFSAQAWHWVSPEVRYVKAREVLSPGGAIAVFWTRPRWERTPHRQAMLDAYREADPDFDAVGRPGPMNPANDGPSKLWGDWPAELRSAPGFEDPEVRSYDWSIRYSATGYVELLHTHSDHMLLAHEERRRLFDAIEATIGSLGGELELAYVTDLHLARACRRR